MEPLWRALLFSIRQRASYNCINLRPRLLAVALAIEGAGNHFIALFVSQLLEKGEIVYSIPPSLTSQYRARRGRKKNDVIDARNVARALLANSQLAPLRSIEQQRELQELFRAQRRLSEQLKANRGALQELITASPVREILQQVTLR